MARIDNIVSNINLTIAENQFYDRRFQKGTFYGIAERIEKFQNDDSTEVYPGIVSNNGDITRISIDDNAHWWLYHRIQSIDTSEDEFSFGDVPTINTNYSMVLVLWADKKKLQLNSRDIITGLIGGIPTTLVRSTLASLNLWGVGILTGSINTESQSVYRQEFTTAKFPIKSSHIMISLEYQVSVQHRQTCIDVCTL